MYGRARRLKLIRNVSIIVGALVVSVISFFVFMNIFSKEDERLDYSSLVKYMNSKGFACEALNKSGSACKYNKGDTYSIFSRRDEGFEYSIKTDAYYILLYHLDGEDKIIFKTNEYGLNGYKNKSYTCTYKDTIVGELDKCISSDDDELDSNAYIGQIENAMYDVNNMILASKFDYNALIKDYKWKE